MAFELFHKFCVNQDQKYLKEIVYDFLTRFPICKIPEPHIESKAFDNLERYVGYIIITAYDFLNNPYYKPNIERIVDDFCLEFKNEFEKIEQIKQYFRDTLKIVYSVQFDDFTDEELFDKLIGISEKSCGNWRYEKNNHGFYYKDGALKEEYKTKMTRDFIIDEYKMWLSLE
jgi:hypothetical protein